MVTTTKNSIDISLKNTTTNVSGKSTSESCRVDNSKTTLNSETSKSEDFKDVLTSKSNSKDENTQKVDNINKNETSTEAKDTTKIDELKENLKKLEEDSKSTSKDDVNDILTELLNLLNKLGVKEEDLKSNGEINPESLKTMIEGINGNLSSNSNSSSTIEKLVELLKNDSVKDGSDTDSLKIIEKVLSNLNFNVADDNTEATKDIESGIKDLISEISNMVDNKKNQSGKILTLEDLLNKNYSQDNKESSTKNESNDILNELMNLTSKLGVKEEDIKSNGEVNSDILQTIIQGINEDSNSNSNLSSGIEKLRQPLQTDSVKDGLDTDSLKLMQKLLSNLSANIADDNTKATKDIKSSIKNLMSEISNVLDNKESSTKNESNDDILTEFMNLISNLGIKKDELKPNEKINSDILKTMIEGINGNEPSESNLSSNIEKLMELLKIDSVKDKLDTDSLKSMEKLLSNLSVNLADDNTKSTKNIKSGIKDLMSEISNMLDNKQSQTRKVLTLEDILNKNYSQDNKESSTENKTNNATTSKDSKEVSKEDKFLNSLINDDKDSSLNKINLFASRTQAIQNQGVDNVRGLTINKATFTDDLIKDVKFMSNNGLKELTIKVNPGNLGEITIKLVQEDGVMKANLKANSKETTALLSQNLTDIKKQLGEQNIKIADVNVELYQDDTTFFKEQGFGGQLGGQLAREQGRSNNSKSNTVNNATITEEDLVDDIASNDSNIDIRA